MALTRTQIDAIVAKIQGSRDLSSGGVLALKEVLNALNDELTAQAAVTREVFAYKSSDQTAIGATFADVTGVGIPVAASGAYAFEFALICDSDATTTGIDVCLNGPASFVNIQYTLVSWTSATAQSITRAANYGVSPSNLTSNGATNAIYTVNGIFVNGANAGTLNAQIKREAVGSGPAVRAGSYSRSYRLA